MTSFVFDVAHEVNRSMNPCEKSQLRPKMKDTRPTRTTNTTTEEFMISERVGQATWRHSERTSRRNSRIREPIGRTGLLLGLGPRPRLGRGPPRRRRAVGLHLPLALEHPLCLSVHFSLSPPGGLKRRAGGTRTPNRRFWRPVLYQLSYCPIRAFVPSGLLW